MSCSGIPSIKCLAVEFHLNVHKMYSMCAGAYVSICVIDEVRPYINTFIMFYVVCSVYMLILIYYIQHGRNKDNNYDNIYITVSKVTSMPACVASLHVCAIHVCHTLLKGFRHPSSLKLAKSGASSA